VGSLANRTASGAAWTIVTNLGSSAISLGGTLVLARFIDPTDYGEVLGASALAASALALSNMGLGQYLPPQTFLTPSTRLTDSARPVRAIALRMPRRRYNSPACPATLASALGRCGK
jgi:hypothetical protein